MVKQARTKDKGSIAFDGVNITHFSKGDVFDGKKAERLVEIGFADWVDQKELEKQIEAAHKKYELAAEAAEKAAEAAEKAAEAAEKASQNKKQAAEAEAAQKAAEAEAAQKAAVEAEKEFNSLIGG